MPKIVKLKKAEPKAFWVIIRYAKMDRKEALLHKARKSIERVKPGKHGRITA